MIFSYSVVSDSENCVVRNIMLIEKIIKRYRIKVVFIHKLNFDKHDLDPATAILVR